METIKSLRELLRKVENSVARFAHENYTLRTDLASAKAEIEHLKIIGTLSVDATALVIQGSRIAKLEGALRSSVKSFEMISDVFAKDERIIGLVMASLDFARKALEEK